MEVMALKRILPVFMAVLVAVFSWHCSDSTPAISEINHPPVLQPIGARSVEARDSLRFSVYATDPEGSIPSFHTVNLPAGAVFEDNTDGSGKFEFAPDSTQVGNYSVIFIASDGEAADSEDVRVTVLPRSNRRPVLAPIEADTVLVGENLTFTVTATDEDGDSLVFSCLGPPQNSTFTDNGDGTGIFSYDPDSTQVGFHVVWFEVTDG